jgi:hypothetical protein
MNPPSSPRTSSPSSPSEQPRRIPGETDGDYAQRVASDKKAKSKADSYAERREERRNRKDDTDTEEEEKSGNGDILASEESDADFQRAQRDREELRIRHGQVVPDIGKDYFADAQALSKELFNKYSDLPGVDYFWVRTMLSTTLKMFGDTWVRLRDAKANDARDPDKRTEILSDPVYSDQSQAFDPGFANPEPVGRGAENDARHAVAAKELRGEDDRADSDDHGPSADETGGADAHPAPESTEPARMRQDHPELDDPKKKSKGIVGSNMSSDQTPKEHKD